MLVLGISAFYHDSAAALVKDGEIIAAAQEERFTREKGDKSFPRNTILYCLTQAGMTLEQVDYVAFYDKPLLTFDRLLETYISFAPKGLTSFVQSIPLWTKEKLLQKPTIYKGLNDLGLGEIDLKKLVFGLHHHSHAASAFFPSPFEKAAVMVIDGVGEWASVSLGRGEGTTMELMKEIRFPHSLGMLYSAFTYYLGFKVNEGEYKVMGLAPYGEPKYVQTIYDHLIDLKDDGTFHMDMEYFNFCTGLTMTNSLFDDLFDGFPPRTPEEPLAQRHMDIARSIQVVTEDVILKLGKTLHQMTGMSNLCLAGGCALNCVANGRLEREGPFDNIWIQPAAGDAGGAIGAAMSVSYIQDPSLSRPADLKDMMKGALLGPSYSIDEIEAVLEDNNAIFRKVDDEALSDVIAEELAQGNIVGWFQGRMEFGPRALGNRSILGDPRSSKMQKMINLKIKYRESFRPFAPAVQAEEASKYFDMSGESPYMLIVNSVRSDQRLNLDTEGQNAEGLELLDIPRSSIPAVTHVDYSARVQTVDGIDNPKFFNLLDSFRQKTGVGMLVNTSFNIRDEPIVCSPDDAYRCFMGTEMDILVLGNAVLYKGEQV